MAQAPENAVRSRLRRALGPVLAAVYLAAALVLWGAAAIRYELFPHNWLNYGFAVLEDTGKTFELLWESNVEKLHPHEIAWPDGAAPRPAVVSRISRDELTLIEAYRNGRFGLYLVNGAGEIEHWWRIPDSVLENTHSSSVGVPRPDFKWIHGSSLSPDGGVVFTLDYNGVVKLDRCGRTEWVLPGEYHHSLFIDRNGDIWAPFREILTEPHPDYPWLTTPVALESVARISPDGVQLERYSLIEAATGGGFYEGLLLQGEQDEPRVVYSDMTHLNDAEIVSREFAAKNPGIEEGDILVSMRTLDSIAIIDRQTRKFKFSLSGMFLRQHDPDALPNGGILVFDNRTAKAQHNSLRYTPEGQKFGGSRLIEINPRTQEIVWSYEGDAESPFFTSIQGKLEKLANGDVLVVETEGGRVFQVSRETGDIIWQFNNLVGERNGAPVYGRVTGATRYVREDLPFLSEPACAAPEYTPS